MKNIPQKIYLQIDANGETPEDFKDLSGVSWCTDRINENDLEYVSIKAMQEYAELQIKEARKTIMDMIHDEQRTCLDDGEYKALEKIFYFVERANF